MKGISAYQVSQQAAPDYRVMEHDLLLRAARDLEMADSPHERIAALGVNSRLWQALGFDAAEDGNRLDPRLRAQIISLSIWVVRQSEAGMTKAGDLSALVDINRAIAGGLAAAAGRAEAMATAPVRLETV